MSSTRRFLAPYKVISNQVMSTDLTSSSTNISYLDQVSIYIASVNTNAVGQWSVEGSLDNVNFVAMSFDPVIAATTSGNNDSILLDLKLLSFPYIRVKYTRTSGSGTANVTISGKGN